MLTILSYLFFNFYHFFFISTNLFIRNKTYFNIIIFQQYTELGINSHQNFVELMYKYWCILIIYDIICFI